MSARRAAAVRRGAGPPGQVLPWHRKLLFGLSFSLALLGATELALRLSLGPPPPPVRVYQALQDLTSYFEVNGDQARTTYVQISPPPPFSTRAAGPRAAVLGGSSVHAGTPNLPPDREFPALAGQQAGVETLNLGSPGLDSFDVRAIASDLLSWDFSALVVYTGHNDFGNAFFQERYGTLASGLAARARAGLERFQIFVQLHRVLSPIEGRPRQTQQAGGGSSVRSIDPTRWWAALRYLEANLRQVVWQARRADVAVVLITPVSRLTQPPGDTRCQGEGCAMTLFEQAMAQRSQDPEAASRLLEQARDLDYVALRAPTAAQEAVRQIAQEEGAVLVDAARELPREPGLDVPADDLFVDGVHLSEKGHAALAALLAPALRAAAN